jgi:hypothetical protein
MEETAWHNLPVELRKMTESERLRSRRLARVRRRAWTLRFKKPDLPESLPNRTISKRSARRSRTRPASARAYCFALGSSDEPPAPQGRPL